MRKDVGGRNAACLIRSALAPYFAALAPYFKALAPYFSALAPYFVVVVVEPCVLGMDLLR